MFTPWLEYFAEGILAELRRVEQQFLTHQVTPETVLQPYHQLILGYIDTNGFITDKQYAALTDRAKATRTLDFNRRIAMGLIARRGQRRNTCYKRVQVDFIESD
ncbi:MAG: hypothetical protein KJ063_18175 [Anaerolineae bacterium]|nr:hypothetical protein [Anaerolineae bacterium]